MDKFQKQVEQTLLDHEKEALNELKKTYINALKDIKLKVKQLQADVEILEKSNLENKSILRSKIYQLNYQKAMEEQISAILDVVKSENVRNTQSFLTKVYEDSYLGINYSLQQKGIPIIMPINNKQIVKVINKPTASYKFTDRLYAHNKEFKKAVKAEISRGLALGSSYKEIAQQLSLVTKVDLNKTYRIARTEGGRVSSEARLRSMNEAKKVGADIVKQWDATLDGKTRHEHALLDQKWAEIDKPFKVAGMEVMAPHGFGLAHLDVNCRCVLLSVPRWDLEGEVVKYDNEHGYLVKTKNYQDWKNKYYEKIDELDIVKTVIAEAEDRISAYSKVSKVAKAVSNKTDVKLEYFADNQVYISQEENEELANIYLDYYNRARYLRPDEEERYKKLLETQKNGYQNEIITLDSIDSCNQLLDKINWTINGSDLLNTDLELLKEATMETYRIIKKCPAVLKTTQMNRYYLQPEYIPDTNEIASFSMGSIQLNTKYYSDYKKLLETEINDIATNWHTKVAKGNETKGIIVHELGHVVHREIAWEGFNNSNSKIAEVFDYLPKTEYGNLKLDDIRKELIEVPIKRVMKKENLTREEVIDKYVSDYGKTDEREMFAEVFNNSQLGASNSLGDELIEFLEELGQWK